MLALPRQLLDLCVLPLLDVEDALLLAAVCTWTQAAVRVCPLGLDLIAVGFHRSFEMALMLRERTNLSRLHTLKIRTDAPELQLLLLCPALRSLTLEVSGDVYEGFNPAVLRTMALESCELTRTSAFRFSDTAREERQAGLARNLPATLKCLRLHQFRVSFDQMPALPELECLDVDSVSVVDNQTFKDFLATKCPALRRLSAPLVVFPLAHELSELKFEKAGVLYLHWSGLLRSPCLRSFIVSDLGPTTIHVDVMAHELGQLLCLGARLEHLELTAAPTTLDFSLLPPRLKVLVLKGFAPHQNAFEFPVTLQRLDYTYTVVDSGVCLDLQRLRELRVLRVDKVEKASLVCPTGLQELTLGGLAVDDEVFQRVVLPASLRMLDLSAHLSPDARLEPRTTSALTLENVRLRNDDWTPEEPVWWPWVLDQLGTQAVTLAALSFDVVDALQPVYGSLGQLRDLTLEMSWNLYALSPAKVFTVLEREALRLSRLTIVVSRHEAELNIETLQRLPSLLDRLSFCHVGSTRLKPRQSVSIPVKVNVKF